MGCSSRTQTQSRRTAPLSEESDRQHKTAPGGGKQLGCLSQSRFIPDQTFADSTLQSVLFSALKKRPPALYVARTDNFQSVVKCQLNINQFVLISFSISNVHLNTDLSIRA